MATSKAVFLAKDDAAGGSPFGYRLLTVCNLIYRKWGALRLQDLQTWMSSWVQPGMFGGFKGRA
eukprot:3886296-Alexandrium_andersonii.AAC.1